MGKAFVSKKNCGRGKCVFYISEKLRLNPEMKARVLNGSLFDFKCPNCGHEAKVIFPFVYHDMEKGLLFSLATDEENYDAVKKSFPTIIEDMEKEMYEEDHTCNYKFRIVTSHGQLVEKIKCFDAGYDDRLVELLKFHSIMEHNLKTEDKWYFSLFDIIPNPLSKSKKPVPQLKMFDSQFKNVADIDLSILPGFVRKIEEKYDYLGTDGYEIDAEWANKMVNSEVADSAFLEFLCYEENELDDKTGKYANALMDLLDSDISSKFRESCTNREQDLLAINKDYVSNEELLPYIRAFYRYTNFQTVLRNLKKPDIHQEYGDEPYKMREEEELPFLIEYFSKSSKMQGSLVLKYIKALIHGKKPDQYHPFLFGRRNHEIPMGPERSFRYPDEPFNGDVSHDTQVYKDFYNLYRNEEFSKVIKNECVRRIFQLSLPADDPLRYEPSFIYEQIEKLKKWNGNLFMEGKDSFAKKQDSVAGFVHSLLDKAFIRSDIGRCFEQLAMYFYREKLYREAFLNQQLAFRYDWNARMYIKKEFTEADFTREELDAYKAKYNLPLGANFEVFDLIMAHFKSCEEADDKYGMIYYLNLMYNAFSENDNETETLDLRINQLLDEIEM